MLVPLEAVLVPVVVVVVPEPDDELLPDPLDELVVVVGTWLAGVSTQVDVPLVVIVCPGLKTVTTPVALVQTILSVGLFMVMLTEPLFCVPDCVPLDWLCEVPVPEPDTAPVDDTVPVPVPVTLSPARLTQPLQPTKNRVVEISTVDKMVRMYCNITFSKDNKNSLITS